MADNPKFDGIATGPAGGGFGSSSRLTGRLIFGTILLTLGTLWTLDNVGVVDADEFLRYWPAVVLLYGLARLFGWGAPKTPLLGGILTLVGTQMLLHELDLIELSLFQLWPLFLVGAGASILWRSLRGPGPSKGEVEEASNFSVLAIMGANTRRVTSEAFQSADVSAVMGGLRVSPSAATRPPAMVRTSRGNCLSGDCCRTLARTVV